MSYLKTKSIRSIEEKMEHLDSNSLRYQILKNTKIFKSSWIELGQALYTTWKDKRYKEWGYSTFEAFSSKEIGLRKNTALKLLKSYYFLEQKEPHYLSTDYVDQTNAAGMPTYESVNLLRQASNHKELNDDDFLKIKDKILTKGGDAREVKKDLTALIKQREELSPEEARNKKKMTQLKRLLSTLKSLRDEIKISKTLPAQLIKDTEKLIDKLEVGIG